jgi:rhodanese-related sulfurtransferase
MRGAGAHRKLRDMSDPSHDQLINVGPHELAHLLDLHKVNVVDVRDPDEYATCHICGALSDPLESFDPGRYSREERDRLVLCCGTGKRSALAAQRLLAAGAPCVRHLDGGLQSWVAARLSL